MKALEGFSNVLSVIAKWFAVVTLAVMWLAMCYCVLMRYVFHNAPVWGDELCRFCLVWLTFYGGAVALRRRSLAKMDLLTNALPDKIAKWATVFVECLSLALLVAFAVWSFQLTFKPSVMMQRTPAMNAPLTMIYSCMPIGLTMMAIQQFVLIVLDITGTRDAVADAQGGAIE